MTIALKNLVPGSQLTNATATYYTAGAGVSAKINNATAYNADTSAHNLTVYIVPSGGAAGVANEVLATKSVAPGATVILSELIGKNIETGGTIQALADASAHVNLMVSGIEVS